MKYAWKFGIKISNLLLIAVMPILGFFLLSHWAKAEDPGTCFMVTSSGRTISLRKLCRTTSSDSRVFRVPIKRRIGNTPLIDVTFNGKQTFEMVLDTGASSTVITQEMASNLKLKTTGILQAQIADGSRVQFSTGKVKSLAVGEITANNIEVAIAPKAGFGLLGHDFFGKYDIKILETEVEFHYR
ncbi:MAG: retroviral-like aspartic protease family protein [Desmonostoc vinosum HA7617-LM4]|jgi:predicted aspartyl protease|nr:retroviral-like aspartic protease family protein [Desmonostoc vinosum HA7617-LM4]